LNAEKTNSEINPQHTEPKVKKRERAQRKGVRKKTLEESIRVVAGRTSAKKNEKEKRNSASIGVMEGKRKSIDIPAKSCWEA